MWKLVSKISTIDFNLQLRWVLRTVIGKLCKVTKSIWHVKGFPQHGVRNKVYVHSKLHVCLYDGQIIKHDFTVPKRVPDQYLDVTVIYLFFLENSEFVNSRVQKVKSRRSYFYNVEKLRLWGRYLCILK